MAQRTVDPSAVEAEVDQIRSLGIDALRMRWRATFGRIPPKGLTKDIMGRMIAYRTQEQARSVVSTRKPEGFSAG
jgi:hypothetical protein